MTRYWFTDVHDGTDGPVGWPRVFHVLQDGQQPPEGAVVWSRAEREAWEAAPERERERAAWEATRPPPPPPPRPPRRIRSLAFLDRLPIQRQAQVLLAARQAALAGEPMADLLLTRLGAATEVDLDDPAVAAGIAAMQAARMITSAEATALLADPTPEEMP